MFLGAGAPTRGLTSYNGSHGHRLTKTKARQMGGVDLGALIFHPDGRMYDSDITHSYYNTSLPAAKSYTLGVPPDNWRRYRS